MSVTMYALFRRACNHAVKPDAAPLADRRSEVNAVRRALSYAKAGNWDKAKFALFAAEDKVWGSHGSAVVARECLRELATLARGCRTVAELPGSLRPDVAALAAALREDVTATYALVDALEEAGMADFREHIEPIRAAYERLF
jgi:hypothetical protein